MTTVSTANPQFQSAIQACAVALHRMADYELDPPLQKRIHELGERKEFLSSTEHEELLALSISCIGVRSRNWKPRRLWYGYAQRFPADCRTYEYGRHGIVEVRWEKEQ